MSRFVPVAEVSRVYDGSVVLVDSVVGVLQPEGGEVGEHVDEYLVGKLEHYEVVGGQPCVGPERSFGTLLGLVWFTGSPWARRRVTKSPRNQLAKAGVSFDGWTSKDI